MLPLPATRIGTARDAITPRNLLHTTLGIGNLTSPARVPFPGGRGKPFRTFMKTMSPENAVSSQARDLKRSALAVALVMLKELDEALPEKHGAQVVAGALLQHKGKAGASDTEVIDDDHVQSLLLAVTGTIARLLDAVDDKCADGPLKPMLLFRLVEDLAREGYDVEAVLDFVRRAHAGAAEAEKSVIAPMMEIRRSAFGGAALTNRVARLR